MQEAPEQFDLFVDDYAAERLSARTSAIEFNPSLRLAPCPKGLRKDYTCRDRAEIALMGVLMGQLKTWLALERFHYQKHVNALSCVLANLLNAGNERGQLLYDRDTAGKVSSDPRNPMKLDGRMITRVIDFLDHKQLLAQHVKGQRNVKGCLSWAVPARALMVRLEYEKVRVALAENRDLIELRDERHNPKQISKMRIAQLSKQHLEAPVRAHNELWLAHDVTLDGRPLVPFLIRIFNEQLTLGGRFYGEYLTRRKHERAEFLIDGHPTVEPDFSCLHLSMLYAQVGLQIIGDAYQTEGFDRDTIKRCLLRLVNSENLSGFKAMITRSGNPKTKAMADHYARAYSLYEQDLQIGYDRAPPVKPQALQYFISGLPDGIDGESVLQAILERHKPIAHLFGQPDIGLRLQFQDSQIIGAVITRLAADGIPVLPVHDSVRCKVSDSERVRQVMAECYRAQTGQNIRISG